MFVRVDVHIGQRLQQAQGDGGHDDGGRDAQRRIDATDGEGQGFRDRRSPITRRGTSARSSSLDRHEHARRQVGDRDEQKRRRRTGQCEDAEPREQRAHDDEPQQAGEGDRCQSDACASRGALSATGGEGAGAEALRDTETAQHQENSRRGRKRFHRYSDTEEEDAGTAWRRRCGERPATAPKARPGRACRPTFRTGSRAAAAPDDPPSDRDCGSGGSC